MDRISQAELDDFKKRIIDAVTDLKVEDDPHVIVVIQKGHDTDNARRLAIGCSGFFIETGIAIISNEVGEMNIPGNIPMLGKGGEA